MSLFLSVSSTRSTNYYLEKVFKVGLVVGFALQQGGGVELAGAEADVGLHVRELRFQQVSYELNRHVLSSGHLPDPQGPGTQRMMKMLHTERFLVTSSSI